MSSFIVREVFRITGLGIVAVGQVSSGVLRPGMRTLVNGKNTEIKTMERNHSVLAEAKEGENVGILLKGADYDSIMKRRNCEIQFS